MRASRGWAVATALLVGAGWALRWWHMDAASIWWDELVQIRTAGQQSLWRTIQLVRLGAPVGSGNAGAVPLDYVLLHLWMRLVPQPGPDWLEIYFRTPACLASCATLAVVAYWTWRTFGPAAGLATTALTAASLPLLLYAGEARFYSLFLLFTVLNLVAFTSLVRDPARTGAWFCYAAVSLALIMSGLFGLLILPWQLVTLFAVAWQGTANRRRALVLLGALVLAVGVILLWYYAPTDITVHSVRRGEPLPAWHNVRMAFGFFGMGHWALPWALAFGPLAALAHVWRRHRALRPVMLCTVAVVLTALPIILQIAHWKRHFFHPRHALFLQPLLLVLLGVGIAGAVELLLPRAWIRDRGALAPAVALGVALVLGVPSVMRFVNAPGAYFRFSKTPADMRSVARMLRDRTRDYGSDDRYLLITNRGPVSYLGNPVLIQYLDWYGIGDRVSLRSTVQPAETLAQVRELCWKSCWYHGDLVDLMLQLASPLQLSRAKRRLLGRQAPSMSPGRPQHIGLALYLPLARWKLGSTRGYRKQRFTGIHLFELARPPRPEGG
jgi:hypothetical protein